MKSYGIDEKLHIEEYKYDFFDKEASQFVKRLDDGTEMSLNTLRILRHAKTLDGLCDEFITRSKRNKVVYGMFAWLDLALEQKRASDELLGAIWTDDGLSYILKYENGKWLSYRN